MLAWLKSSDPSLPLADPAHPSATLPVPLAQSEPAKQASWRDHIEGALTTTIQAGTHYGAAFASGAVDAAGSAAQGATHAASLARRGTGEVVDLVGRYGADSANSALKVATHAVSGIGRMGGTVIDLAVVSPAAVASRSAATVAEAAIVKPARAISKFILIVLGIVCSSAVAIAGFIALAMYFYHTGNTHNAPTTPTIIMLQPGQTIVPQPGIKAQR